MNKKSKRKNDLRSSIILLLILLLLLISSTYAWFTANQTVKISSIDVHIEAQNGLQISTDATKWKSIIDNADITDNAYSGNTNQMPENMEPVSTIGEVTADGRMRMFYGTVTSDDTTGGIAKLTATEETFEGPVLPANAEVDTSSRKYVAFDIFLKVEAVTRIQLGEGSGVVMTPVADVAGNTDKGIKQASRVAFCVLGNKASGTAASEITPVKGGLDSYIWEPNYNLHTTSAQQHAKDNYGVDIAVDGTENAITYYGIKTPIAKDIAATLLESNGGNTTNFEQVTVDYKSKSNEDNAGMIDTPVEIFTLQPGVTKVRVYMWIEGQDFDCENVASGTDISYTLQLDVIQ